MHHFHHYVVGVHVRVVVPFRQISLGIVVGHENVHAFEQGAVLDNDVLGFGYFQYIVQALLQEVHFQGERPALDVFVIIGQIRVVGNGLELGGPAIMAGQ